MGEVVGTAVVEIHARLDALEREIRAGTVKASDKAGKDSGKVFGSSFKKSAAAFTAGFLGAQGIQAATRQIVNLGKASVQAASNLEEQASKASQVFGDATGSVQTFASTSVSALGLASDQVLEIAGSFGALFRPLGLTEKLAAEQSIALTKLGADLASFYNTDVADALNAIKSGLVGEVEPLRRFGVVLSQTRVQQEALNETGKKSVESLTSQELVLARTRLIYSDAGLAVGDFQRTSDGLANQQRILSAAIRNTQIQIGTALIPVVKEVVSNLAEWFSDTENQERVQRGVTQAVETTTQVVRGFVDVFKTVKAVLDPVVDALGGVQNALEVAFGAALLLKLTKATAAMKIFGTQAATAGALAQAAGATSPTAATAQAGRGRGLLRAGALVGGSIAVSQGAAGGTGGSGVAGNIGTGALIGAGIGGAPGAVIGAGIGVAFSGVDAEKKNRAANRNKVDALSPADKAAFIRQLGGENRAIDILTGPAFGLSFAEANRFVSQFGPSTVSARARRGRFAGADAASRGGAVDISTRTTRAPTSTTARTPRGPSLNADLTAQIREQQALQTETTSDDLRVFAARKDNIEKQISNLQAAGLRGKNDQNRLIRLLDELSRVDGEINSIEEEAQAARNEAREERKRINQEKAEQAKQDKIDALQEKKDDKERSRNLREARLQLRLQKAELSGNKAQQRSTLVDTIKFYDEQAKSFRKQGAKLRAVGAEAEKVSAQQRLKDLKQNKNESTSAGGARTDFFQEAASQFRTFGSNIGRAGDPLSGQDARGQFAGFALDRRRNTANLEQDQLNESQSQTSVLREIRDRLRVTTRAAEGNQPPNRRSPTATDIARVNARNQLAGR